MKIVTIVGARPQFIKAAVVSRAIADHNQAAPPAQCIDEHIVHTGQHYDDNMSEVFFREMQIPNPRHHLGIGGGKHGEMTGRMLEALEKVLFATTPPPDWVLIYGDTNSTLAGALAAAKLHIPVAHVEAGLRSFNRRMPEEINRILADHAADLLFAPTETAVKNLRREGIDERKIANVGDVMFDAMLFYKNIARAPGRDSVTARLNLNGSRFALATIHRAENTDDPKRLRGVMQGLAAIARRLPVVLPLHPRTRGALVNAGMMDDLSQGHVHIIDPVGYLDMVVLESSAALIATDSGGVQKEAYFNGVPCLTLRDETEWVELVDAGVNFLCGADAQRIAHAAHKALSLHVQCGDLYGDGHAGAAIVQHLLHGP